MIIAKNVFLIVFRDNGINYNQEEMLRINVFH